MSKMRFDALTPDWVGGRSALGLSYPSISMLAHSAIGAVTPKADKYASIQLYNPYGSGVTLFVIAVGATFAPLAGYTRVPDADVGVTIGGAFPGAVPKAQIRTRSVGNPEENLEEVLGRVRPRGLVYEIEQGWGLTLRYPTADAAATAHFEWVEQPVPVVDAPPTPYTANAVHFSSTYIGANETGVLAASKTWLFSAWFRWLPTGAFQQPGLVATDVGASSHIKFQVSTGSTSDHRGFSLSLRNASNTEILVAGRAPATSVLQGSKWHHLMISVDLTDTNRRFAYLDGEPAPAMQWVTYINDEVSLATEKLRIGQVPNVFFPGNLGPVIVSNTYLDLSIQANREKFIKDSKPVQPVYTDWPVVFDGPTAEWHVNKGTAGDVFTLVGTLTDGQTPVELA